MINQTSRTLVVKRHEGLLRARDSKPENFVRLVLTHHDQTEQILIERDCPRQVGHLNANVVDFHGFQSALPLRASSRCRAAGRREHGETLDQFSARELSSFEAFHQIGNDGFHTNLRTLNLDCAVHKSFGSLFYGGVYFNFDIGGGE